MPTRLATERHKPLGDLSAWFYLLGDGEDDGELEGSPTERLKHCLPNC